MNETTSVLEDLFETVENGRKGFAEAAEKLEDDGHNELAAEMRELSSERARISDELRTLAAAEGVELDGDEGTAAGAMHRAWMALKDALTGDDPHAVLAAAEQGEDHAVSEYESALAESLPEPIRSVISRQANDIRAAHDRVRALRDSNA